MYTAFEQSVLGAADSNTPIGTSDFEHCQVAEDNRNVGSDQRWVLNPGEMVELSCTRISGRHQPIFDLGILPLDRV